MDRHGVSYRIQTDEFVTDGEIKDFIDRFDHILVHFDVDVLDEKFFHSTYFANPTLSGDGSGGGRMRMDKLEEIFGLISENCDIAGLTRAEYLPFDEYRLRKALSKIKIFSE